jgi:hypothetical protein
MSGQWVIQRGDGGEHYVDGVREQLARCERDAGTHGWRVVRYRVRVIMVHGTKLVFRERKIPPAPTSFLHLVTACLTSHIPSCKSKLSTLTETLRAKESITSIEGNRFDFAA